MGKRAVAQINETCSGSTVGVRTGEACLGPFARDAVPPAAGEGRQGCANRRGQCRVMVGGQRPCAKAEPRSIPAVPACLLEHRLIRHSVTV